MKFLKEGKKGEKENIKGCKVFSYLGIVVNLLPWLTNKFHIISVFFFCIQNYKVLSIYFRKNNDQIRKKNPLKILAKSEQTFKTMV